MASPMALRNAAGKTARSWASTAESPVRSTNVSRQKNKRPPSKAARASSKPAGDDSKGKTAAKEKPASKEKAATKDKSKQTAPAKPKSEQATQRQVAKAKAERRQLLKRTGRNFLLVVLAGAVVLGISAWRNRDRDPVSELGAAYAQAREQVVACGGTAPDPAEPMDFESPDDLALSGTLTATVVTSCGDLVIELDADQAPDSVNSFVFLADQGFYDGTVVYSIRPEVAIEAGDQTAMGDRGPGYRVVDEPPADDYVFERGTVALAAGGGPNRSDSRFMIVLGEDVPLADLNVIGQVTAGDAVLDRIAEIDLGAQITGARTRPLETIYIESVAVDR